MIECIEYWNKVVADSLAPFGTRVSAEYEIKNRWTVNGTLEDLKHRYKNHPRMTIDKDKITEDAGKHYGIHSYVELREISDGKKEVFHGS